MKECCLYMAPIQKNINTRCNEVRIKYSSLARESYIELSQGNHVNNILCQIYLHT